MQAVKLSALCRQTPRKVPVGTKAAEPFCLLTATCSVRAFNTMPALATRGLGSWDEKVLVLVVCHQEEPEQYCAKLCDTSLLPGNL